MNVKANGLHWDEVPRAISNRIFSRFRHGCSVGDHFNVFFMPNVVIFRPKFRRKTKTKIYRLIHRLFSFSISVNFVITFNF